MRPGRDPRKPSPGNDGTGENSSSPGWAACAGDFCTAETDMKGELGYSTPGGRGAVSYAGAGVRDLARVEVSDGALDPNPVERSESSRSGVSGLSDCREEALCEAERSSAGGRAWCACSGLRSSGCVIG